VISHECTINTFQQSTEGAHTAANTASRGDAISTTVDDWELTGDREPSSEEVDRYVLSGRIKHLPERHPKMVRIFLSSTFTGKIAVISSVCDCSRLLTRRCTLLIFSVAAFLRREQTSGPGLRVTLTEHATYMDVFVQ